MPTWGVIQSEIQKLLKTNNPAPFDVVRNKYIKELSDYTKRNVIVYASRWTSGDAPPNLVSIIDEDIQAFMEAIHGLKGDNLDLILHTGGGSAESVDAIVSYLRQKFSDIRIIVPQAAMSAGTMLTCSANEVVMGKHSSLGPIDPQFILQTSVGLQAVPAHAIIEQFEKAQKEITANPNLLSSWLPMLSQYGPALLVQCKNQIDFGKQLVKKWLQEYMFKGNTNAEQIAVKISDHLSNHANFKTHSKHLNIQDAKSLGLKVIDLESDQKLQERVLSAFHSTMCGIGASACKIISNQNGNAFIKNMPMNIIATPPGPKKR